MTSTLLTRLARVEAQFPPTTSHFNLSGLTEDELEMLAALPRDEARLRDLIEDPAYDWSPLSRILGRLEALPYPSSAGKRLALDNNGRLADLTASPVARKHGQVD